jgi:hypothetical protein
MGMAMAINYKKIMEDSIVQLSKSLKERRKLDNEIARLQKIARWSALQQSSSNPAQANAHSAEGRTIGLTEAVCKVLRLYETWLSPVLVRDLLSSVGFEIAAYHEPLPSIHVTLKRLVSSGEAVQCKASSGGSVYTLANPQQKRLESPSDGSMGDTLQGHGDSSKGSSLVVAYQG